MARNQLPEGVGKKIVEALKRQAEADVTPVSSKENNNLSINEDITDADFDALQESSLQGTDTAIVEEDNNSSETFNVQNTSFDQGETASEMAFDMQKMQEESFSHPIVNESVSEQALNVKDETTSETTFDVQSMKDDTPVSSFKEPVPETPLFKANSDSAISFKSQTSSFNTNMPLSEEPKKSVVATTVSIRIPTNVAVLRNLIASLPVGVTKQTGAQIIRQTLEAMGLPMAGVLKEAQEVQEELNTNTRECMLKIQEYKTNIMQLEQSVQEYQKNVTQINDLVSLFLLTDRK